MRSVSDDGLRAITGDPGCAVACYGGASGEVAFYGLYLGIHFKYEDGLHWLEHGYPMPRLVFATPPPIRGKREGESWTFSESETLGLVHTPRPVEPGDRPDPDGPLREGVADRRQDVVVITLDVVEAPS